jgi:2-hydroxychromene-2-carboxylate isomerase
MWRDIERRASKYGVALKVPAPYPLEHFDLANKVAIVGRNEGWCPEYAIASYKRWFQQGLPAGNKPNLSGSLKEIGQDPDRVIALANSPQTETDYENATNEAKSLGIFGSPSFMVDGELFWGDDRLEDALAWRKSGGIV